MIRKSLLIEEIKAHLATCDKFEKLVVNEDNIICEPCGETWEINSQQKEKMIIFADMANLLSHGIKEQAKIIKKNKDKDIYTNPIFYLEV